MTFKGLQQEDKSFIAKTHANNVLPWDDRMGILMKRFNVSERTVRKWISKLGLTKYKKIESEVVRKTKLKSFNKKKRRFILTWGQNATPVFTPFLENIKAYAKYIKADILVQGGMYKNPSSAWAEYEEDDMYWDDDLSPYLTTSRQEIHPLVTFLSDVKILPTSKNPLLNTGNMTANASAFVGHPRMHMTPEAVLDGFPKKFLATTGAVTIPNYTETSTGKLAEFHHVFGFVVIELDGDDFHFRQVTANTEDGSFNDLWYEVSNKRVKKINKCDSYTFGDLHIKSIDNDKFNSSLTLTDRLVPNYLALHDLLDGKSASHWDKKDPILMHHKFKRGDTNVEAEEKLTVKFVKDLLYKYRKAKLLVIRSNHDEWFDRWIKDYSWKRDIENSHKYAEYLGALLANPDTYVLKHILESNIDSPRLKYIGRQESYLINEVDHALHGDKGKNGSRGTIKQFSKLNTKVTVGHSHTPMRVDGAMSVGTSTPVRQPYSSGPTSNIQCDIIQHLNGKRQHIIFNDKTKKYTTFE